MQMVQMMQMMHMMQMMQMMQMMHMMQMMQEVIELQHVAACCCNMSRDTWREMSRDTWRDVWRDVWSGHPCGSEGRARWWCMLASRRVVNGVASSWFMLGLLRPQTPMKLDSTCFTRHLWRMKPPKLLRSLVRDLSKVSLCIISIYSKMCWDVSIVVAEWEYDVYNYE